MAFFYRWYVKALLDGNPFVVGTTVTAVLLVATGPFFEGLSRGEARSIGFAVLVGVLCLILLVVAVADSRSKRNDRPRPHQGKRRL